MANLRVLLDGKELYNIALAKGREYLIGRSESSDIVLNKSSISRQHMKIFFDSQSWHIELISKISKFSPFGEEISNLLLTHGMIFTLEGYEFRFVEEVVTPAPAPTPVATQAPPVGTLPDPAIPHGAATLGPDNTDSQMKPAPNADNTALATRVAATCLHAINEDTGEEVLYTLEGNHWIAGRSSACQIKLSETKSSRQHFELLRTTVGFEIIDLGSSNGTYLNGKRLVAQSRTPVGLGDEIKVGKTTLIFEMRSPKFEEQLAQVSHNLFEDEELPPMESEPSQNLPATIDSPYPPQNDPFNAPAVIKYQPVPWQGDVPGLPVASNAEAQKKKKFYMIGGSVLLILIAFALSDGEQGPDGKIDSPSITPLDPNKPPTLEKMTPEQKSLADRTYKLAKKFYIEQKYQLAKAEVDKLHGIVPFYLDSRDMEKYINEAIQIESDRLAIEVRKEKQKQIEEQVKTIVKECTAKMSPNIKVSEIQACLQPVQELDPENKDAQALIDKATAFEDQRNQSQLAKETREAQIKKGLGMYNQAKRLEEKDDLLAAMDAYNRFASSGLPDPAGNKIRAREAAAGLQTKITSKVNQSLEEAKSLKSQEKFKEAFLKLKKSANWDPSDSRILDAMRGIEAELKKKMKVLYNDGVLEENIGNLESAKTKWRTITEQDLNDGEYYRKARTKLKRYGE